MASRFIIGAFPAGESVWSAVFSHGKETQFLLDLRGTCGGGEDCGVGELSGNLSSVNFGLASSDNQERPIGFLWHGWIH